MRTEKSRFDEAKRRWGQRSWRTKSRRRDFDCGSLLAHAERNAPKSQPACKQAPTNLATVNSGQAQSSSPQCSLEIQFPHFPVAGNVPQTKVIRMTRHFNDERLLLKGACLFIVSLILSCSKPSQRSTQNVPAHSLSYTSTPIGTTFSGQPWIAHIKAIDLDQDGLTDFVACDAKLSTVFWIRKTKTGQYEESLLADDMRAPVHIEAADIDSDGDTDLIVACMSFIFPNNDKIGAIIALENLGQGRFGKRILLDHVSRVSDVRAADFNQDGKLDLAVGQFGYDQGEIRWMRQTKPWQDRKSVV